MSTLEVLACSDALVCACGVLARVRARVGSTFAHTLPPTLGSMTNNALDSFAPLAMSIYDAAPNQVKELHWYTIWSFYASNPENAAINMPFEASGSNEWSHITAAVN